MYLSKFSNVLLNCVTKSLLDIAQIGEGIRQPKLILTLFNSFPSTWWGENSLGISIWNSKLQALQTKRYTIHRKKNTCLLKFTKMTSENRQFKMHSKLLTLKCLLLLMWMWMKKCLTATILLRLHEGQWGPMQVHTLNTRFHFWQLCICWPELMNIVCIVLMNGKYHFEEICNTVISLVLWL